MTNTGQDEPETTFTGQYGFVLFPEEPTAEAAAHIAERFPGNKLDLRNEHRPHLTLYHTKVKAAPEDFVDSCLAILAAELPCRVFLEQLEPFGNRFVFWHARRYATLVLLHDQALALAKYFDKAGPQQSDRESLQLNEAETRYVRRYGHPQVLTNWQPHITVAYVPTGPDGHGRHPHEAWFTSVAFVEIGENGTILRTVKTRQRGQP